MMSKPSQDRVKSYPLERCGSSQQEMKGKMFVKDILLMTHGWT